MPFNSLRFALFFLFVCGIYLTLRNHKWQNIVLLLASCVFYCIWDFRFLLLIFISITLDFFCGLRIYESENQKARGRFLLLSIAGNLSILCFFKYFNFFTDNLYLFLSRLGISSVPPQLNIILPLGISFYTFKTLSYTIDIYRRALKPTDKFIDYALFVIFFPQLLAGPIERARNLLPQIQARRTFSWLRFREGCYLIFWGLYQKVFVADSLAKIVDPFFSSNAPYAGAEVLIAGYAFSFQLFCDFAGYSNIARGLGNLLGFETMVNFTTPFFVTNIQDFWKRWHISLSTWVYDYIYMPLFFALKKLKGAIRIYSVIVITMIIMGFWHGAKWTYVCWGFFHGSLLFIYSVLRSRVPRSVKPEAVLGKKAWFAIRVIVMYHLTVLGMLIFRAESMTQFFSMLTALLSNLTINYQSVLQFSQFIIIIGLFFITHLAEYLRNDLFVIFKLSPVWQLPFYLFIFYSLLAAGIVSREGFIYLQF